MLVQDIGLQARILGSRLDELLAGISEAPDDFGGLAASLDCQGVDIKIGRQGTDKFVVVPSSKGNLVFSFGDTNSQRGPMAVVTLVQGSEEGRVVWSSLNGLQASAAHLGLVQSTLSDGLSRLCQYGRPGAQV